MSKPYVCPSCLEAFAKWGACQKHLSENRVCHEVVCNVSPDNLQQICRVKSLFLAPQREPPFTNEQGASLTCILRFMSGTEACAIEAETWWIIADVKAHAAKKLGIPAEELRLFKGCRECADIDEISIVFYSVVGDFVLVRRDPDHARVLTHVKRDGLALRDAPEHLKSDHEIVLTAVRQNWKAFVYAADDMKANPAIVLAAVEHNGLALQHAAEVLREDSEVVIVAVQNNGMALKHAGPVLKASFKVVSAAVSNFGGALQFAAEEMRSDCELVKLAVQHDGRALQYAAQSLRANEDIVIAAILPILRSNLDCTFTATNFGNAEGVLKLAAPQFQTTSWKQSLLDNLAN